MGHKINAFHARLLDVGLNGHMNKNSTTSQRRNKKRRLEVIDYFPQDLTMVHAAL